MTAIKKDDDADATEKTSPKMSVAMSPTLQQNCKRTVSVRITSNLIFKEGFNRILKVGKNIHVFITIKESFLYGIHKKTSVFVQ